MPEPEEKVEINGYLIKEGQAAFIQDILTHKEGFTHYIDLSKFAFYFGATAKLQDWMEKKWAHIELKSDKNEFQREKVNEAVMSKLKFAIRKGVPLELMRKYILCLFAIENFNTDLEYNVALRALEESRISKAESPTFGQRGRLERLLIHHCLNREGMEELRTILLLIKNSVASLTYSPFLPVVISILLLFIEKADVLKVLRIMISESEKMLKEEGQYNRAEELRGLRWYFPLDKKDYYSTIETFTSFMSERSSSVRECLKHLEKIDIDPKEFMQYQFTTFFLDYVPLDIITMLFAVYLNEGIKIMFRIGYAFFKTLKEEILCTGSKEDFDIVTKETLELLDDEGKKRFVNVCFHLRIVKIRKQFSLVDTKKDGLNASYFYDPVIIGESKIFGGDGKELKALYQELPAINKANDLKLIYSSWDDGRSMKNLVSKAEANTDDCIAFLILMQDNEGNVIGAYLQHEIGKTTEKRYGSPEDFVFRLRPTPLAFYFGEKPSDNYFDYRGDDMLIGIDAKACALRIDSELVQCTSEPTQVFGNPASLVPSGKKEFIIKYLELYKFV